MPVDFGPRVRVRDQRGRPETATCDLGAVACSHPQECGIGLQYPARDFFQQEEASLRIFKRHERKYRREASANSYSVPQKRLTPFTIVSYDSWACSST